VLKGKRLHSLVAYSEWLRVLKGKPVLPLVEQDAYDHVGELHLEGSPLLGRHASERRCFRELLLGAVGAMALLASVRVGVSALRSFVRERMLRQRVPLRVVTVD
jgi:hypothetical protein